MTHFDIRWTLGSGFTTEHQDLKFSVFASNMHEGGNGIDTAADSNAARVFEAIDADGDGKSFFGATSFSRIARNTRFSMFVTFNIACR